MHVPILRYTKVLLLHGAFCVAVLVNRTIDDTMGDIVTGFHPIYKPPNNWVEGSSCTGCGAFKSVSKNLTNVKDATWHDATYRSPGVNATGPLDIVLDFTGTAVYVYHIVINAIDGLPQVTTLTNLSFIIDGDLVGQYINTPLGDRNFTVAYQVPVYVNTTLPNGPHSLVVRADGTNNSLVLFDYAQYTIDDPSLSSHAPYSSFTYSPLPGSAPLPSPSSSSTPQRASTHTGTTILAAVTCVVSLAGLCGIVVIFFRRRHAWRSARMGLQKPPSSPCPAPFTAPAFSVASFRSESSSTSTHVSQQAQELPLTPLPPARTALLPASPVITYGIHRAPSHDIDVPGPAISMSEATTERQLRIASIDRELRLQEEQLRRLEQARSGHGRLWVVRGSASLGSEVSESRVGVSGRDEKIALLRVEMGALRAQVDYERRLLSETVPRRPNRR
ncbi:hypothetical protein C8Q80DRAFT_16147 [Daedaleopsis nitida]|nr:hypothetical protein C8Q80DRAFT_16147 [Daedaleopsis nitida]